MNKIKCPKCGQLFELNEAFKHELEEKLLVGEREKHKTEITKAKQEAENQAAKKANREYENELKRSRKDAEEEKANNKRLLKQLEDLSDELRRLTRKDEERDLEMKRKIANEEEKIRRESRRKFDEEHELKDREQEKLINDLKKSLGEAQRKAQQGSQQTQGEVLELELEEQLKKEFPLDLITEVKKGQRGADVKQKVVDKKGRGCGTILYETKNAEWSKSWIKKLREDQRVANADLAVLVVANPPEEIKLFSYQEGIWVTTRESALALAYALRFDLIHIYSERLANVNKDEKIELLHRYLRGVEFKHRIEAIVEGFSNLQDEIEKEKRWFNTKWARQEKEIRKVLDNTHGMYGDLQAYMGKGLPEIKSLKMLPEKGKLI